MKGVLATREETKTGTPAPRREHPVFYSLQHEMNKLFDEFRHSINFPQMGRLELGDWQPRVDIKDTEKEIVVTVELPGVEAKDIDVSLRADGLAIRGEKRAEREEKDKGYYKMERSYGSFYRLIPLPLEVDRDKVAATHKDGVVKITLPKTQESIESERKIDVKTGA